MSDDDFVRRVRRSFRLFTGGEYPCIDRLSIMMTVLGEMTENERRAALAYAADFYGFKVYEAGGGPQR